ncbi:restriction endonuclease [Ammonifex degensii KC4]|uniref:Restriction endonuclease n=1 Tax=Ammonifex degensii (strain DSM 10501 / KC4) TaxID=429009 RepID=C9RC81_AMMDK|nr:restriction endonuclease [Ammonifex degensii]ACX51858.1 restriction endonuclease [Ammonifex degensii KC4]
MKGFFAVILNIGLPLLFLVLLAEGIRSLPGWLLELRVRRAGLDEVDAMSGHEFEVWLEKLFRQLGYRVRRVGGGGDGGADLILTGPDGKRIAVQAKKLRSGRVGVAAISEVLRGQRIYSCAGAWVVTNRGFTKQALEQASKCGVKLLGREDLARLSEAARSRGRARPQ